MLTHYYFKQTCDAIQRCAARFWEGNIEEGWERKAGGRDWNGRAGGCEDPVGLGFQVSTCVIRKASVNKSPPHDSRSQDSMYLHSVGACKGGLLSPAVTQAGPDFLSRIRVLPH